MSLDIFSSAYSGNLVDRIHNLLLANTSGAVATSSTPDLWMQFLAQRGYTTGTLNDRQRQWLLSYLSLTDTGQTLAGLWAQVLSPFSEGISYLLDTYTGAVVAYSTARKLRGAYAGAAFRVRRSSDNAEQDIGFSAGLIDTTALTTFVGASDGLIVTWYDQSTNGRNVTQATASLQPAIILAGVLQTQGSNAKPAIKFDGTDDRLISASAFNPNTPTLLGYWIDRHDITNTAHLWGLISGTIDGKEMRVRAPGDAATTNMRISVNSTTSTALTSVPANTDKVGRARAQADASPVRALRINKGTEVTGTPTADTGFVASKNFCIGAEDSGSTPYNGVIGELIVFPTFAYTADNAIDDNIMNFWGVV